MLTKRHGWRVRAIGSCLGIAALAGLTAVLLNGLSQSTVRADDPLGSPIATSGEQSSIEFLPLPSENERKIVEALKQPSHMEFQSTPLAHAIDYLKDLHQIEIQIDEKALADAGIDLETSVTKSVKGIPLRSALRLLLGQLDLTAIVQDEVLLITTTEVASNSLSTRTYPVRDLAVNDEEYDSLTEAITSTVRSHSWEENGGEGKLSVVPSAKSIVIAQTPDVHDEVLELLRSLRTACKVSPSK